MLLLLAVQAHASAYYNLDSGTRALGRAGAYVVGADDLSAMYYNPAALGHIERTTIGWNGWAINQYVMFDRADEPGEDGAFQTEDDLVFAPVNNESGWFPIPNMGAAFRMGGVHPALKDTVVAAGLYTPTAPTMAFPSDGAQRYSLVDSLVWQLFAGVSASQKLGPVTLGAGFNYTLLRVEESLAVTTVVGGSDDPKYDVGLDIAAWDKNQFSWNAGVIVQPIEPLEIGLSVQPSIKYTGKGEMTAIFNPEHPFLDYLVGDPYSVEDGDAFTGTGWTDDDILLYVTTPWVLKGGVQVTPVDTVRVEADFVYTTWSQLEELVVAPCAEDDCSDGGMVLTHKPDNLFLPEDVPVTTDVGIPTGFTDAWSLRVGGDVDVTKWLEVRAGGNYETSAVPTRLQGVSVVDGNKLGYGVGGTFRFAKRWAVDVGLSQQFIFSRTISDSEFRQITMEADLLEPENTAIGAGKVVGNGDFASRLTYAGIGATVYFGAPPDSPSP